MESNLRLSLHICAQTFVFQLLYVIRRTVPDAGDTLSLCLSEPGDSLAMRNRCWSDGNIRAIETKGKQAEVLAKPLCFAPYRDEPLLMIFLDQQNDFHPLHLRARS